MIKKLKETVPAAVRTIADPDGGRFFHGMNSFHTDSEGKEYFRIR